METGESMSNEQNTVTEIMFGFKEVIPAQIFWASLADPKEYHIAKIVDGDSGETLGYLVKENE